MNLIGGAKAVHSWTRQPVVANAPLITDKHDAKLQSEIFDDEVSRLQDLWGAVPNIPEQWDDRGARASAPGVDIEQLRWASASFGVGSAHSGDGLHPKHYSLCGDRALRVLAIFTRVMETTCLQPQQLQSYISFFVVKPKGGFRVINLFSSFYRVWIRFRRGYARRWEQENFRHYLAFTKGGGCTATVFRQAVRQETSTKTGHKSATLYWDMKEYYEGIDRSRLVIRARQLHFPSFLLDVALRTYQYRRIVTWMDFAADAGSSSSGLPAGCGLVTSLVASYVIAPVDAALAYWASRHITVALDIYIDDIAIGVTDVDDKAVIRKTNKVANDMKKVVEEDLRCVISRPKSQFVASNDNIEKKLRASLGPLAGQPAKSACNLGIDSCGGIICNGRLGTRKGR